MAFDPHQLAPPLGLVGWLLAVSLPIYNRFRRASGDPMFPLVAELLLEVVPQAVKVVKAYGGIKGLLGAERAVDGCIRKAHADWKAAKAATSPGGVKITPDEAKVIAVDIANTIEAGVGPLINVAPGTDLITFGEDLFKVVAPAIFKALTGQDLAAFEAALTAKAVVPPPNG